MAAVKNKIMDAIQSQVESSELEPTIDHIWEIKRFKSLENWMMAKPNSNEMAEAGFYCPNPDVPGTVKCFSCFIELDGWEPTDKPWEEHKKRALTLKPPCKFIEIGKKEADHSVEDFLEIQKSVMLRILSERCEKSLNMTLSLHKKKKIALKKDLQKIGFS